MIGRELERHHFPGRPCARVEPVPRQHIRIHLQHIHSPANVPTHLSNEAVLKEQANRTEHMPLHAAQTVVLIRIDDLLEEHATCGQRLGQRHALLHVHIIISGALNEQELLVPQLIHIVGEIALLVALVVVRHIRAVHVALRVGRV